VPSNRRHLSCDDCLEDKSEDYQNCSVLYCVPQIIHSYKHTHMSSSYSCTSYQALLEISKGLIEGFFVVGVFSPLCFALSVPLQVIVCKDSSLLKLCV